MGLAMEQQSEIPSEVVLTTETFRGIAIRGVGMLGFGLLCFVVTQKTPPAKEWSDLAIRYGFLFDLFVFMVLSLQLSPRGIWSIDADGIRYQPCHGRDRFLAWTAIELLQWENLVFQSQTVKIVLPLQDMVNPKTFTLTRALLEQRLSNDFDLKPMGRDAVALTGKQKRRLMMVLAIITAVIGILIAGLIFADRTFPESDRMINQIFVISMIALIFSAGIIGVLILLKARSPAIIRQKHPEWPWRVRRSKAQPKAPIDREFELV